MNAPWLAVAAWLAFVADVTSIAALLVSPVPDELKVGVVALNLIGIYTIAVVYIARKH